MQNSHSFVRYSLTVTSVTLPGLPWDQYPTPTAPAELHQKSISLAGVIR